MQSAYRDFYIPYYIYSPSAIQMQSSLHTPIITAVIFQIAHSSENITHNILVWFLIST